jgi:hypothetical protein
VHRTFANAFKITINLKPRHAGRWVEFKPQYHWRVKTADTPADRVAKLTARYGFCMQIMFNNWRIYRTRREIDYDLYNNECK